MNDHIDVGATPPMEDCAQVGTADYFERAGRECRAYIGLLRRALGPEPTGATLAIKSNPHDFGTYLSVACYYDVSNEGALNYAFRCESGGPEKWDAIARRELKQKGVNHE